LGQKEEEKMIKLKELIELRSMGYYKTKNEIKKKHRERINQRVTIWDENLVVPKKLPPENDSKLTMRELKMLQKIKPNNDFVESGDDIKKSFMPLIEKHGVKVTEDFLSKILKESGKYIMELKYHYNRPRPYQVAEFYNLDLGENTLESMKTPSYPSGHAVQGYLIGEYLSKLDPHNSKEYRQKGEDIAHSRLVAKAHYPSDKVYGKEIASHLATSMKKI
tara:strand:- start:660 stop:1319 length:660 start_codon:yes stop_codon:yes gene_type:complete